MSADQTHNRRKFLAGAGLVAAAGAAAASSAAAVAVAATHNNHQPQARQPGAQQLPTQLRRSRPLTRPALMV